MRGENPVTIANPNEHSPTDIIKKFFAAFHEKFGKKLERHFTDYDFDKREEDAAHVAYMFERDVTPGVSVIFEMNADKHDPSVLVGFGMIKSGQRVNFGDKEIVNQLREHYGVEEKKAWSEWFICFDYLMYEGEEIKLINSDGGYGNFVKLFDPEKFDKIVDSAVEQAQLVFARLKQS